MFTVVYFVCNVFVLAYSQEEDYGPDYGEEWLYFVDENGTTQVMNFSSLPDEARGFVFGETYFNLFTRVNPTDPELLEVPEDDQPVNSTFYNPSNKLRVITHGWLSSDKTEWLQEMRDSLLRKFDINVITVDWSELSKNPAYPWPALSTRYVGKRLAKLLNSLDHTFQVNCSTVHLIGHSLGAQVMGYAGMFSQGKIGRITGLDPARPLFELPLMAKDYRLEKSDALFVDIIHTCGGVYGYRRSHGHADFYPNNGRPKQPGCEGKRQMIDGCSHGRSCEFFGESIESEKGFMSYPCDSWDNFNKGECIENPSLMGYPADVTRMGDFYLHTRNHSKYAEDVRAVTAAPPQWAQEFEERRLAVDVATSEAFTRISESLHAIRELLERRG